MTNYELNIVNNYILNVDILLKYKLIILWFKTTCEYTQISDKCQQKMHSN